MRDFPMRGFRFRWRARPSTERPAIASGRAAGGGAAGGRAASGVAAGDRAADPPPVGVGLGGSPGTGAKGVVGAAAGDGGLAVASAEELVHATPQGRPPAEPASVDDAADGLWSASRRSLTIGLVLTITLAAFEALAVATIMPIVARDLGGFELYGWVFTAFFLGSLIGIVVVGGTVDQRGLVAPFAIGLGLFAIGLVGAGLAPTMQVLIGARFIQGLGGGAIPPIAYVAIARSLPERLRPRMFATLSTAWVLPGVIGPAIAGTVAEHLHWRVVFLGLLPLIAISGSMSFAALSRIPASSARLPGTLGRTASAQGRPARNRHPARLRDAILVAAAAGLVTGGLTSGQPGLLLALVGAGLVLGLPAYQRLTPRGTLRLGRGLPAAVLLRGALTFAFFGVDAYVALTLIGWRGIGAGEAGITLTAATLAWTAGSWIQARGATRWGYAAFVRVGFGIVAIGIASFAAVLSPSVPVLVAVPTFGIAGFGMGLAYAPLSLIVLREAPAEEQGAATAALSLSDVLGTALGTGIAGAIVAAGLRSADSMGSALAPVFVLVVVVAAAGTIAAVRLRVPEAGSMASGAAPALR